MRGVALAIVIAAPLHAETKVPEPVDFDLFQELYTDKFVDGTDPYGRPARVFNMGDGVVVTCGEDGCAGEDDHPVACDMSYTSALVAMVRLCPDLGTPDERAALEAIWDRLGNFVYANGLPQRRWDDVEPLYDAAILDPGYASVADECEVTDLSIVTEPGFLERLDGALARPRLPVYGQCY